ncbi:zinc ribbon domain-containing protein, partial [Microcystis sp. M022S1]|uniref:zinc ribbon domain-containing protein n=1 Tax=Microcystis sp. M022S1 TaxID=2771110 RepID=UPI00258D630D
LEVDSWFPSSKRCSTCGYIAEQMPLYVREWDCPNCGTHNDRDINASKNILAAGLAVSVCRATIRPSQSKTGAAGAKNPSGKKQKLKS